LIEWPEIAQKYLTNNVIKLILIFWGQIKGR